MRIAAAAASAIASARCFAVSDSKCKSMRLEQHNVSTRHFGESSSHVTCVIFFQGPSPRQMICHQYLILLQGLRRTEPVVVSMTFVLTCVESHFVRRLLVQIQNLRRIGWDRCLEFSLIFLESFAQPNRCMLQSLLPGWSSGARLCEVRVFHLADARGRC